MPDIRAQMRGRARIHPGPPQPGFVGETNPAGGTQNVPHDQDTSAPVGSRSRDSDLTQVLNPKIVQLSQFSAI